MGEEQGQPMASLREAVWKQRIMDRIRKVRGAISATIPGTSAFKKRRQDRVEQLTNYYTRWIDELSGLSPEAKQRLTDRILYHVGRLNAIDALGEVYSVHRSSDALSPMLVLGLLGSVFVAILGLRAEFPWWAVFLVICLFPVLYMVAVAIIVLLAAAIVLPVRWLGWSEGLVRLVAVTGMALAALVLWQGYLQSRNALGVLGYPMSETSATWVIVMIGGLYLLLVVVDIAKKTRGEGRLKALFRGLFELDNLLAVLAGMALAGFPLYRSSLMADSSPVSILNAAAVVGLSGALVFWIGLGALTILLVLVELAIERYKARRYPDAILVRELFWILWAVEKKPEEWQNISFKRSILARLETAAAAMARISRELDCGDAVTDAWSAEEFHNKAAFLRYLKTWVLTPMADTRDVFMNRIARELTYAASGTWDALAKPEDEKVLVGYSRARDWRSLASGLLRDGLKLVTGLIPLGAILALQQTAFALEQPVSGYLTSGATIWALVRVLQILDPQWAQTFAAVKDVQDLLPQ